MAQYQLNAETRSVRGKQVRHLRAAGYVPAILYGREADALLLKCDAAELGRLLGAAGTTSLVDIIIDGDQRRTVLVRDVQIDPVRRTVRHLDLYQVVMTETVKMEVGIALVGEPVFQGNIFQDMTSVEIECLPQDLVSVIEIDISRFTKVGQSVTVADLDIPQTVTVLAPPEEVVVHTEALKKLEEEIVEIEVSEAVEPKVVGDIEPDEFAE